MKMVLCSALLVILAISFTVESRQVHVSHHHSHQNLPRDEDGEEYLPCLHRGMKEEESGGITKCKMAGEPAMGVKSLGLACMGVFFEDGTPVKQGCWVHQMDDVINKTCEENTCVAEMEFGPYFCCCTTPLCNRSFARRIDLNKDHLKKSAELPAY